MKKASINFEDVEEVYKRIDVYFLEYLEKRKIYLECFLKYTPADDVEKYYESMRFYSRLVDHYAEVLGMLYLLPDGVTSCDILECLLAR